MFNNGDIKHYYKTNFVFSENLVSIELIDKNLLCLAVADAGQMLLTVEDNKLTIADIYFGFDGTVDEFATGQAKERKVKDPYLWNDTEWVESVFSSIDEFLESEKTITAEDFTQVLYDSMKIETGMLSATMPNVLPEGYSIEDLQVDFTVRYPQKNGSSAHDSLFYDMENIELGTTYALPLSQPLPDGTEASRSVYFAKDGKMVGERRYSMKIYPLRDDTFTPSVDTTEKQVVFTDRFNDKFIVSLDLPSSWVLVEDTTTFTPATSVDIFENDVKIGLLFYSGFKHYPEAEGENYMLSVYSGLMLGSVASWNNEYKVISKTDTTYIETCKPFHRETNGTTDGPTIYSKGILSHDTDILKYFALSVADNALTDEEWLSLAKSVTLAE